MDTFKLNSLKERDALKKSLILEKLRENYESKGYEFGNQFLTPYDDYDKYDAIQTYMKYKDNKTEYLRILIETKVRSEIYDEMFLEYKKWLSLLKIKVQMSGNYKLLYINFTPNGTYIYDLTTELLNSCELVTRKMKDYTSAKDPKQIDKKVYLLPLEKAKFIPFIYDESSFQPNIKKEVEKSIEIKKLYDIFGQINEIDKCDPVVYQKKTKNIDKIVSTSSMTAYEFDKMMAEKEKEFEDFLYDKTKK